MAVDTVVTDAVEPEGRFGNMAFKAGSCCVHAEQWETVVLMELGDVVHEPVLSRVAAGAVVSDGHLVYIGVAGDTGGLSLRKYQALVAFSAISRCVLSGELKIRLVVVEEGGVGGEWQSGSFGYIFF